MSCATFPDLEQRNQLSFQCPVCANPLPHLVTLPPFDAPCSDCGFGLWCRRVSVSQGVFLEAVSGKTPEPSDVDRVIAALPQPARNLRVVLDLGPLEYVSSLFVARLVTMNRRIRKLGGCLVLTGLQPVTAEIFRQFRLDQLFEIEGCDAPLPLKSPSSLHFYRSEDEKTERL